MIIIISSQKKLGILIFTVATILIGTILGTIYFQSQLAPSIRLGALSGDLHHLPLFVAVENGYFIDEGLDFDIDDIVWFPNGNEVMIAFEAGILDVSYLGLAPAMAHKLSQNAPVKIISSVNVNGSAIMARSGINTVLDLSQMTIGVPSLNNMQDFILQIALNDVSLSVENVTRSVLSVANMQIALETNQIDAFVAWEPFNAKASEGQAIYLKKSSDVWKNHPCCVLASSTSFLSNHQVIRKLVQINRRAIEWIQNPDNHANLINIARKYTGITSDSTIIRAIDNVGYVYDFTTFQSEIERFYDNLTTLNPHIPAWSSGRDEFFQEFFDSTYLNEVN